jgi:hypothetical protein
VQDVEIIANSIRNAPPWPQPKDFGYDDHIASTAAFHEQLKRLARLDTDDLDLVFAFVDLIESGDMNLSDGSWVLSLVKDLLQVVRSAGADPPNEFGFPGAVGALAGMRAGFEGWIDDARRVSQRYPAAVAHIPERPAEAGE